MTNDELAAIEARANAATPGPWKWTTGRDMLYAHVDGRNEYLLWTGSELPVDGPPTWASALAASGDLAIRDAEANAAFLAGAREDVPALVAEVRRLQGLVAEMKREIRAATAYVDGRARSISLWARYSRFRVACAIMFCEEQHPSMADDPKYKPKTVPFASPKLAGGRFDGSSLPLELLPEFDRFRTLVVELAKTLFRARTGRQRVPAGFEQDLKLRLTGIEKGSTVLPICRELPSAPLIAAMTAGRIPDEEEEDYPDYDDALGLLEKSIEALSNGEDLPSAFPMELLPTLEDFGAAFEPAEVFELRRPGQETGARLDVTARLRLRSADDTRRVVPFTGTITGFDWDGSFKLRPMGSSRTIPGKHDFKIQDDLLTALKQKQYTRVRIAADTRFTPDGTPKQIVEVLSLALWSGTDEATVRQVESRFQQLSMITDGWLEGEGRAIDSDLVVWLKDWLIKMMAEHSLPKPRLYPTPEGNIEAEWSLDRYELTATFDLLRRTAALHAANLDDDADEHEGEVDLNRTRGDESFAEFFARFRPQQEGSNG